MTLDLSMPGKVAVDMKICWIDDYIFSVDLNNDKIKSLAGGWFSWNEKNCKILMKQRNNSFTKWWQQDYFIQTRKAVHSNVNCVSDDQSQKTGGRWLKILFRLMTYLNGKKEIFLTLSADGMDIFKWFVAASYATHSDMKSFIGSMMAMVKGRRILKSLKQKLNTKISTAAEIVGADDIIPDILWSACFLKAPGYESFKSVMYQDNNITILLKQKGIFQASKGRNISMLVIIILKTSLKKVE